MYAVWTIKKSAHLGSLMLPKCVHKLLLLREKYSDS